MYIALYLVQTTEARISEANVIDIFLNDILPNGQIVKLIL
jgi:hypothetical protein